MLRQGTKEEAQYYFRLSTLSVLCFVKTGWKNSAYINLIRQLSDSLNTGSVAVTSIYCVAAARRMFYEDANIEKVNGKAKLKRGRCGYWRAD